MSGVTKGSPAEAAELRVGDVILSFGSTRVEDDNHLINLVSQTPVDREIDVRILRDGTIQTIKVKVANRTPGAGP